MRHVHRCALRCLTFTALTLAACGGSITTVEPTIDSGSDDASADAPQGNDAPSFDAPADALYLACMDAQGQLDASLKTCQSNADCVIRREMIDCCGTTLYVGVNVSSVASFGACESAWEMHFPGCGCASNQTKTEDGKTSNLSQDAGAPQVHCTNFTMSGGICLTYTP